VRINLYSLIKQFSHTKVDKNYMNTKEKSEKKLLFRIKIQYIKLWYDVNFYPDQNQHIIINLESFSFTIHLLTTVISFLS
jgi:hypothetical protein